MYNCNFEAINQFLNKRMEKLEMEYGQLISTIIFYPIPYKRFRKVLLMLSLRQKFLTFARDFFQLLQIAVTTII